MNWKALLIPVVTVIVGLIVYDMFVKKMVLKEESTFDPDDFESTKEIKSVVSYQ